MGGILDSIFGGGQSQEQTTTLDPTTQALNKLKMQQAAGAFGTAPLSSFGQAGGNQAAYTQAPSIQGSLDWVRGSPNIDVQRPENLTDQQALYKDYYQSNFNKDFNQDFATNFRTDYDTNFNQNFDKNFTTAFDTGYTTDFAKNFTTQFDTGFNRDFATNFNQDFAPRGLQTPSGQLMSMDDYSRFGLDASQNYINRIASPSIRSNLALQGLEGSGALPESIARATAEYALPFIQTIPGVGQANAAVRLNEAANARQNAALQMQGTGMANEALQQRNQAQLMSNAAIEQANQARMMGNTGVQQFNQALVQGNVGREQANAARMMGNQGIFQANQARAMDNAAIEQANQARLMGDTGIQRANEARMMSNQGIAQANQAQQMDNATYTQMANTLLNQRQQALAANEQMIGQQLLPEQNRLLRSQTANQLFSMADQPRALAESDLLRRMGLSTTAFTGLPYTPAASTTGETSRQPLFNFFGQG